MLLSLAEIYTSSYFTVLLQFPYTTFFVFLPNYHIKFNDLPVTINQYWSCARERGAVKLLS